EALLGQLARGRPALGALLLADRAQLADAVELLARVDGPDIGVLVERVADAQRLEARLEPRDDLVVDVLLHEKAAARAADVTLVEEDAIDDTLDRLVDGGVVEDDVRRLAAQLEGELLARARRRLGDRAADRGRPREGHLVDVRVVDEGRARVTRTRDDV